MLGLILATDHGSLLSKSDEGSCDTKNNFSLEVSRHNILTMTQARRINGKYTFNLYQVKWIDSTELIEML